MNEITVKQDSQATKIVNSFLKEDPSLFHDERGVAYTRLPDPIPKTIRLRSHECKRQLAGLFYEQASRVPSGEALSSAINVLEHMAMQGPMRTLHTRIAFHNDVYWLDLANPFCQAVRITKDRWTVENDPPPIFRRYAQQAALPTPTPGGDPWRILNFLNVSERDRQLVLVDICTKLVPDIPHPVDVVYGPQGGAKTTFCEFVKGLIDPSVVASRSIPYDENELIQALDHNYVSCFDNVSAISDRVSDDLCRVTTGTGFSKRMLYSDDEDVIYSLQKTIMINGINVVAQRPDLLDRAVIYRLPDISDAHRKSIQDLKREFELAKPFLLGALLDTFVKALNLPEPALDRKYRMADFTVWAYRFAEALDWSGKDFLTAYSENVMRQAEESVQSNVAIDVLIQYLNGFERPDWEGTATQLLANLTMMAADGKVVSTRQKTWPKSPTALSRLLNDFREPLRRLGYAVTTGLRDARGNRLVRLEKPSMGNVPENASNTPNETNGGASLFTETSVTAARFDAIDAFDTRSGRLAELPSRNSALAISEDEMIRGLVDGSKRNLWRSREDVCEYVAAVWGDAGRARQLMDRLASTARIVATPDGYWVVLG